MKSRSCGLVHDELARPDSATPHSDPSEWGHEPLAGAKSIDRATFSSFRAIDPRSYQFGTNSPVESRDGGRLEGASRIGVRDMLSCQSPMPAGAGTPRYEKPELWLGTANWHGGFCHAPTPTLAGDKPLASRSLRPHYISPLPAPLDSSAFAGKTELGPPCGRRWWYRG